jgi:hypothetical protein
MSREISYPPKYQNLLREKQKKEDNNIQTKKRTIIYYEE